MKKMALILCTMLFSAYSFGRQLESLKTEFDSLESLKTKFDDSIKKVEAIEISNKQGAQEAIHNLMNLRQKAREEIKNKSITRSELPQLRESRKVILKKMAQLTGVKKPKRFKDRLKLMGFKKLDKAGKAEMLISKANELLDKEIGEGSQKDLISLFNLKEQITIFKSNNKDFLQNNSKIEHELTALSDRISNKLVAQNGEDVVEEFVEKGIPTPPPLPPRDREAVKGIPTPPPLPPDLTKKSDSPDKKPDLMEEIRSGREQLKPASERERPSKPKTHEESLKEAVWAGTRKLKPAEERELGPKPEKEKTQVDKLKEDIRKGLKPSEIQAELRDALAKRREAFGPREDEAEEWEDDDESTVLPPSLPGDVTEDVAKEDVEDTEESVEKGIPIPPPLPPWSRKEDVVEVPVEPSETVVIEEEEVALPPLSSRDVKYEDSSIPIPPPLPPWSVKEDVVEVPVEKDKPTPPSLPHRPPAKPPKTVVIKEEEVPLTEPTSTPLPSQQSDLLEAIRGGAKLKPVSERETEKSDADLSHAEHIKKMLEKRRGALKEDVVGEESDDDEDWD